MTVGPGDLQSPRSHAPAWERTWQDAPASEAQVQCSTFVSAAATLLASRNCVLTPERGNEDFTDFAVRLTVGRIELIFPFRVIK
jgi:hypothetical protein